MSDRVHERFASVEDHRLGIMENLISRYLANEFDLRQFSEFVCISRLHYPWGTDYTGHWLRELTFHHLFMFRHGNWPESALRESLAFLLEQAVAGTCRFKTPMLDRQWLDLMDAGHVPGGFSYHRHTEESVRRMTPQEREKLRRTLNIDRKSRPRKSDRFNF